MTMHDAPPADGAGEDSPPADHADVLAGEWVPADPIRSSGARRRPGRRGRGG